MRTTFGFQKIGIVTQESRDCCRLKAFVRGRFGSRRFSVCRTDRSLFHIFGGGEYFLRAVGEAIYFFRFRGTLVITVEGRIDSAERGFERNARVFPGLNQRPVESGEEKARAPAAQELLFYFGEVVEVVFHGESAGTRWSAGRSGFARNTLARRNISFPDDAQAFESEEVIHMLNVLGSSTDHGAQSAGGDHVSLFAKFREKEFENTIDQAEVAVVQAGLQTAYSIGADDASWLANLNARKAGVR